MSHPKPSPVTLGWVRIVGLWLVVGFLPFAAVTVVRWAPIQRAKDRARSLVHLKEDLPHLDAVPEYASSKQCQSCHPSQHASWHRTFHRTMTQIAVPENVRGSFKGETVMVDGVPYRVGSDGERFWAEMPDPDVMMYVVQGGKKLAREDIPRVRERVVMTTGSHHYQTYWVASPRYDRLLQTLPLVYLIADERWIPREAAFMHPPRDQSGFVTQWNHHCIRCHSTAGNPGLNQTNGMLDSRVAELGISCEACHGPGEKHVQRNRNPIQRYSQHLLGKDETTIVNPAKLDHRRSSQVCGQCHGVYVMRDEFAMQSASEGALYQPGEDLDRTRYYIQHPANDPLPIRNEELQKNPNFFRERWWDDGTILAGGREYSALTVSGCYQRGKISCLSCHTMHGGDPSDQLKPSLVGNKTCTQCHLEPKYNQALTNHTFHSAASPGSDCMNCHMPYSTYALLGAIRSHQIVSPRANGSVRHGTPNACNLCHLDRTLAWTQENLHRRYGHSLWPLTPEQQSVSAALVWLLKGDAAQRVITAWHVGWTPAQQSAGSNWLARFQAELLTDPYGVVRYVAADGLHRLPGFQEFNYDFLAPPAELERRREAAIALWNNQHVTNSKARAEILLQTNGLAADSQVDLLLRQRNNRPVSIKE